MATGLYLIPVVRQSNILYRIPKYFWHAPTGYEGLLALEGVRQGAQTTKQLEDLFFVVVDLDATQEAALTSQSDVIKLPDNLNNTIPNTTVRDAVRNYLEAVYIPANWVVVGMSYRTILRIVLGLWEFRMVYLHFAGVRIYLTDLNLDKVAGDLPQETRDALQATADYLNIDYSGVTLSSTIREILYMMGQQFSNTEFKLGLITI